MMQHMQAQMCVFDGSKISQITERMARSQVFFLTSPNPSWGLPGQICRQGWSVKTRCGRKVNPIYCRLGRDLIKEGTIIQDICTVHQGSPQRASRGRVYTKSKGNHNTRGRDIQEECRRKLILGLVCTSVWALQIGSVDGGREMWRGSLQVSTHCSSHCVCTSSHNVSVCVCVCLLCREKADHTQRSLTGDGAPSRKPEWRQTKLSKLEFREMG